MVSSDQQGGVCAGVRGAGADLDVDVAGDPHGDAAAPPLAQRAGEQEEAGDAAGGGGPGLGRCQGRALHLRLHLPPGGATARLQRRPSRYLRSDQRNKRVS